MKIDLFNYQEQDFKVTASYLHQEQSNKNLSVLPGAGFSHMEPCLYYPSHKLFELGYNVLNYEYDFRQVRLRYNENESYQDFYDFLISSSKDLNHNKNKIVMAKSIGTRIFASAKDPDFKKYIWLTPAIKDEYVRASIIKQKSNSLVIIGNKDPFYSEDIVNEMKIGKVKVLIIPGADHSLDIDNDISESLIQMKSIVDSVENFIKEE